MGVLLLKCPSTDLEFSTGIHLADEDSFRKLPDTVTKATCPHCGLEHTWWTREARWTAAVVPSMWVERRASSR